MNNTSRKPNSNRVGSTPRRRSLGLLAPAVLAALATTQAQGAALTWDADTGTTLAQAGNGTWNTSNTNWWTGSANVSWNNATPDAATFGQGGLANGDNYTVTLGSDITAASVTRSGGTTGMPTIAPDGGNLYKLTVNGGITVTRGMQIDAPLVLAGGGSHSLGGSYPIIINGKITETGGANSLAVNSAQLTLAGNNAFSGSITLGAGSVSLGHNNAAGTASLKFAGGSNSSATWNAINGNRTIANALDAVTGIGATNNAVTFGGDNLTFTYSSPVTIEGKTGGTNTTDFFNINVNNTRTEIAGGLNNGVGGLREIGFVKNGAGTLVIGGTSTFTGDSGMTNAFEVNVGTLLMNGTAEAYAGAGQKSYQVAGSATLGGNGSIKLASGSLLNVVGDGNVAPGQATGVSIGTFTVNGNTTIAGNLLIDVDSAAAGQKIDLLTGLSGLDLSSATDKLYLSGTLSTGTTYTLAQLSSGSIGGTFNGVYWNNALVSNPTTGGIGNSGNYKLVYNTDSIQLAIIPEPSTLMGLAGIGAMLGARRGRRRG